MDRDIYQTNNLNLAAFLYSSELEFVGITKTQDKALFGFKDKNKSEKLVMQYYAGRASTNPRELFARLNDLKDLLFSGGRS